MRGKKGNGRGEGVSKDGGREKGGEEGGKEGGKEGRKKGGGELEGDLREKTLHQGGGGQGERDNEGNILWEKNKEKGRANEWGINNDIALIKVKNKQDNNYNNTLK